MTQTTASWNRVEFELSVSEEDFEPSDFVKTYHGKIIGRLPKDGDGDLGEDCRVIGKVCVHIVELDRIREEGESLFEVMDSLTADTCDCFEQLFDPETEDWKTSVESLSSEERLFCSNLMILDRLELHRGARGRGIGKQVALRLIEKLGYTCGVIACKPSPLQFTSRGRPLRGIKTAQKRVRDFWRNVGFVPVPESDYYVWPR